MEVLSILTLTLGRVLILKKSGLSVCRKKGALSSDSLGIWTSAPNFSISSEEITEGFSLHDRIRVSVSVVAIAIVVPVRGHDRESHASRDPFKARSSRSIWGEVS